jgi:trimeric autotransporter adhesin
MTRVRLLFGVIFFILFYSVTATAAMQILELPLTVQSAISANIGADDRSYRSTQHDGKYQASNKLHPLVVDPLSQQEELTASDGAADDGFGLSVSISSDGNTLVVGAGGKKVGNNDGQGVAYVFVRSGGVWTQQTELTASDGTVDDLFGISVSINSDGTTLVVGAAGKTVGSNTNQGAAYIFVRSGDVWTQQAKLTASDGSAGDVLGFPISLSSDGNTLVVGAGRKKVGINDEQGAAYVFVRSGSAWTQQAKLTASDGAAYDWFGFLYSVSLSSDGNTAVIGAGGKKVGNNDAQGAAYVFVRSGGAWTQQAKLTASDGAADDGFSTSVSLSSDGNTAVIGAGGKKVGNNDAQGAAYVFMRSGGAWTQQAKLTASDGAAGDWFGVAVSISTDESTVVIGAPQKTIGTNIKQGAAYLFVRNGSIWPQQASLTGSDGAANDWFGFTASTSGDGNAFVIGAPQKKLEPTPIRERHMFIVHMWIIPSLLTSIHLNIQVVEMFPSMVMWEHPVEQSQDYHGIGAMVLFQIACSRPLIAMRQTDHIPLR